MRATRHPWVGRATLVRALAVTALAALCVVVLSGPAAQAASANWAWIIVRHTGDHTPPTRDRGNSAGSVNRVVDLSGLLGPGTYGVELDDVGPNPEEHGAVLVSTLGRKPRMCTPYSWEATNDDVSIVVACFTRTGDPAPAAFVLNWLAASGTGGRLACATDHSPVGKCGPVSDSYHSQGSQIVNCAPPGTAELSIGALGPSGVVQTHALTRTSSGDASAAYCSLAALAAGQVTTACFDVAGAGQVARRYSMWYLDGLGLKGVVGTKVANLLADKPKRDSYRPPADHRYASSGKTPRIERLGRGRYQVTLPGTPGGGSAQVTPVAVPNGSGGWVPRHCIISSIAPRKPQRVGVRCFNPTGALADSRFMLSYAK
jgi:hypothetical protein